ncbi:MAG: hypothetical protein KIT14_14540 [bacterium]|nr:hypothetical protein [bacterium]
MEHDNQARRAQTCAQLRRAAEHLETMPIEHAKEAMEELAAALDELGRWSERAGLMAATGEEP